MLPQAAAIPSLSSPPPSVTLSDLAPADAYFGHVRYSILVIRHKIFALKNDLHHDPGSGDAIAHEADTIAEAFADWATRFPKDRWLPRTGWELATLYEELPGSSARDRAVDLLLFVRDHYGWSAFAADSAKDLARGVGVRAPVWAPATATASSPTPVPIGPLVARDAPGMLAAVLDLKARARTNPDSALAGAIALEAVLRRLSQGGADPEYARASWELAAIYQSLPGEDARVRAIRLLSLLVDRYADTVYGRWGLRDLERGIGTRS